MSPADSRHLTAVLFDWDGTLLDSADATFRSYQKLFGSFGIGFDRSRFAETYSPDWYRTYEAVALAREHWSTADSRWLDLYAAEAPDLIAGAAEAIERLRSAGLSTGLVTSGSRGRIERDLAKLGVARLFDVLVCSEDAPRKKPHPDPLRLALERLSVPSHEAACVGDSPEDVEMARAAGVFSVAIAGAFPNHEALKKSAADLFASTLAEAVGHLSAMSRGAG
ncbi:MAG TPA: HAD family hydrolase [Thermoanaerobaculia bacterium]